MQLSQSLRAGISQMEASDVASPRLNAELLLMFVLGCERAHLYSHPEQPLTPEQQTRYQDALAERARGVPAQYVTGHQEFWGLDIMVSPAVLIPRPETEHVVEAVLELARLSSESLHPQRMVDVGTGSGSIALALAHELRDAEVHATEISLPALEVARANASCLQLDGRITFHHADLLAGTGLSCLDFVVSNPPYVGRDEADKLPREVRRFEPEIALFAGRQGMDLYRRLIPQAAEALRPGGWIVMEIGFSQQTAVSELLAGWGSVTFRPDLRGIPRVVLARR